MAPALKSKQHDYIPELMKYQFTSYWIICYFTPQKSPSRGSLRKQQATIAHVNPSPNDELAWQKRSRFHSSLDNTIS